MTRSPIRLNLTPGQEQIHIGDHNVANVVRAVTVTAAVGELPTVTLDLNGPDTVDISSYGDREPRVMLTGLTDDVRRALVAAGWTPPASDTF